MVNPAYRLLLGMVVLLSGVETLSAQAQYASVEGESGDYYTSASYHPDAPHKMKYGPPQEYFDPAPEYYESVDQYHSGYAGDVEQSGMITRVLPVDRGWSYDHPMDGLFKNLANNSWMRIEYLLWKAPPGNQLVGTETTSGNDPRLPFPAEDNTGLLTLSTKEVDLSSIGHDGSNGIRGTFGIDFQSGTLEAIFFGMQSDYGTVSYGQADLLGASFGQTNEISIMTFLDGNVGLVGRDFNQKFSVRYQTQAWGAESNYVINTERLLFRSYYGAGGLQIRPLVGFRYLKIGEEMLVRGSYEDLTAIPAVPLFETTVQTLASNKLYVPQAGIRMEFVHPWFTISAEPKVGFGVNNYNGSVLTNQFLGPTDPTHVTQISKTRFAPTFEFGVNARFHLSEYFTFNVGYNFLWANQIARPGTITYYNIDSSNPTNGVSLQAQDSLDSYKLHGLVIGGEFSWP
ncbi:BBP7 family outer membrane beta-barrel protein [Gimesia sp.]|uniref:BBP7 family outer membrane beta-barrel protein n=1 Tax=Gimesia sp. TaxID=2024833 RepID=UPI003A95C908